MIGAGKIWRLLLEMTPKSDSGLTFGAVVQYCPKDSLTFMS